MANDVDCPVQKAKCNACGRIGHYERCCRANNKPYKSKKVSEVCNKMIFQVEGLTPDGKQGEDEDGVFEVKNSGLPTREVLVNDTRVSMKFDSCSQLTIISEGVMLDCFQACLCCPWTVIRAGMQANPFPCMVISKPS